MSIKNISTLLLLVLFTACGVDYEENPNEVETPLPNGLLNQAQKSLLDATRNDEFSGGQMLVWMQYWNNNIYTEESRYQYQEPVNQTGWDNIYAVAQNLCKIIELNSSSNVETRVKAAVYGTNEAQIAVARTMLVYTYLTAAEVWGDVPYYSFNNDNPNFQANQLEQGIIQPVFAPQEEIYADMLSVLEETAASFSTMQYTMDGDNFYNGEAQHWYRFANSLRLRIANRVKHRLPEAQEFINTAKQDASLFFASNEDNATLTYETNAENAAPMYKAFVIKGEHFFGPSVSFMELLKGKDYESKNLEKFHADPRIKAYAETNSNGFYVGMPLVAGNSEATSFEDESEPSLAITAKADRTLSYLDYAEICFILSEINNWDQTWYEKGVRASMEWWNVPQEDIETFLPTLTPASEETVLTQKYIALYMQPLEAWSEYRRTGYPKTLIMPNTSYTMTYNSKDAEGNTSLITKEYSFETIVDLQDIPYRNKYPLSEANLNTKNVEAASTRMGGNKQDTKLWWMD